MRNWKGYFRNSNDFAIIIDRALRFRSHTHSKIT